MTGLIVIVVLIGFFFAAPVSTIRWIGQQFKTKAEVWASLFPKKEEKKD